jgi:hypothetical protein
MRMQNSPRNYFCAVFFKQNGRYEKHHNYLFKVNLTMSTLELNIDYDEVRV